MTSLELKNIKLFCKIIDLNEWENNYDECVKRTKQNYNFTPQQFDFIDEYLYKTLGY